MKEFTIKTNKGWEVIDITDQVQSQLEKDAQGFCLVYCPHTTGAILVGENEEKLIEDYERTAQNMLASSRPFYHEGRDGPNAEGHLFSFLHGFETLLPVKDGKLFMGKLQRVFFFETSGPRERHVRIFMVPAK